MKCYLQFIRKEDGMRSPVLLVDVQQFCREIHAYMEEDKLREHCVLVLAELIAEEEKLEFSAYPICEAVDFVELNMTLPEPVLPVGTNEVINHA